MMVIFGLLAADSSVIVSVGLESLILGLNDTYTERFQNRRVISGFNPRGNNMAGFQRVNYAVGPEVRSGIIRESCVV